MDNFADKVSNKKNCDDSYYVPEHSQLSLLTALPATFSLPESQFVST